MSKYPDWIEEVFIKFRIVELTTIRGKRPITLPLIPIYDRDTGLIHFSSSFKLAKKVQNIERNPKVSVLFSDPTGSGIIDPPVVLVQGEASVRDKDLDAWRDEVESTWKKKQPSFAKMDNWLMRRLMGFYFKRVMIDIRPERVTAWREGTDSEPEVLGVG